MNYKSDILGRRWFKIIFLFTLIKLFIKYTKSIYYKSKLNNLFSINFIEIKESEKANKLSKKMDKNNDI